MHFLVIIFKITLFCLISLHYSTGSLVASTLTKNKWLLRKFSSPMMIIKQKYKSAADQIIDYLTRGQGKGQAWDRLAQLTDTFGHRMVGEKSLDKAIDYLLDQMTNRDQLDNAHKEPVENLPHWVRGEETVQLISPVRRNLAVLGLGGTVPTQAGGICAKALVVRSFDEMEARKDEVKGRIVVFNQEWRGYGETVQYRTQGAIRAARLGALAVLVRSVASHSYYTPHTGVVSYASDVPKIPAASISIEDAAFLQRLQDQHEKQRQKQQKSIKICIVITSSTIGVVTSYNTVAELKGTQYPNEIVMIGGHLDSWDVGTGAMDDGGGVITALQTLVTLKALNLRPKRTIRAVFWTSEEQGYLGCQYYYEQHKKYGLKYTNNSISSSDMEDANRETFRFVMESDAGAFKPDGLWFTGPPDSARWQKMESILQLLAPINATKLNWLSDKASAGDVELWRRNDGVPAAWLENESKLDYYFTYHHTEADRMEVFTKDDLDYATALIAVVSYVIADLDDPL